MPSFQKDHPCRFIKRMAAGIFLRAWPVNTSWADPMNDVGVVLQRRRRASRLSIFQRPERMSVRRGPQMKNTAKREASWDPDARTRHTSPIRGANKRQGPKRRPDLQ